METDLSQFATRFQIGKLSFGMGATPLLVAETACAHDGSLDELRGLIDGAAQGGADVIQLQVFRAAEQVPPGHRLRELLEQLELSDTDWGLAFGHAGATGLEVMAFVYDLPSLRVALDAGVVALKLNSADLLNRPLLEACGASGLPLFLGTGASTLDEVSRSLACLAAGGGSKVILMHGVQDFPTAVEDARIDRVRLLRDVFGLPAGYGDHTDASLPLARSIDLLALGLGAQALEKHITLDRSARKPDYQAALEPAEWKAWADGIRQAAAALSRSAPVDLTDADRRYRRFQKKFAVAARGIAQGEPIAASAVRFLRLEEDGELSALDFAAMGPVVATRALEPYAIIRRADVTSDVSLSAAL